MRCASVCEQLNRLSDGESLAGWQRYWEVGWHCLTCAACRAEWRRLRQIRRIARTLPASPPPAAIKARLLAALPDAPPASLPHATKGVRTMALKWIGGMAMMAALVVGLLTLPRTHRDSSLAAEVRRALQNVNTWHLTGWKLQNGQPVPWEVWGRRQPPFYREQVGPDVMVDNGFEQVGIFAPNREHPQGLVLRAPSMPHDGDARWSYQEMVQQWQDARKPWRETSEEAIFNFGESGVFLGGDMDSGGEFIYTVDKRSGLPIQFEVHLGKGEAKQTLGFLRIRYDEPLPGTIAASPPDPPGYQVFDMIRPVGGAALPTENAVSQDGLTIQLTPLAVDSRGNVLVRQNAWLGGAPVDNHSPITVWAAARPCNDDFSLDPPSVYDDLNRPYTEVGWNVISSGNMGASHWQNLFAPLEPLPAGSAPPKTLTLTLDVSLNMNSRFKGTLGMIDSLLRRQVMTLVMSLPQPASVPMEQIVPTYLPPHWQDRIIMQDGFENLEAETCLARASHYGHVIDIRNLDRPNLLKATEWDEKYFKKASCIGNLQLTRCNVARLYHILGNNQRARELLHDVLNERRPIRSNYDLTKLSQRERQSLAQDQRKFAERYRQGAEKALQTWARP